jgi:hypothetical protein
MMWWFGTTIAGIIIYALLSAFEAYGFSILSTKEKFVLISLALLVPIAGAYYSNLRLNHRISESGRIDLQLELPFWVVMGIPSKLKIKDLEASSDIDTD